MQAQNKFHFEILIRNIKKIKKKIKQKHHHKWYPEYTDTRKTLHRLKLKQGIFHFISEKERKTKTKKCIAIYRNIKIKFNVNTFM